MYDRENQSFKSEIMFKKMFKESFKNVLKSHIFI